MKQEELQPMLNAFIGIRRDVKNGTRIFFGGFNDNEEPAEATVSGLDVCIKALEAEIAKLDEE